jgi:hypothetical protein
MVLRTFHLFPELSTELRLMIWAAEVAQDAPVVEVSWQDTKTGPFWFCPEDSAPPPSRLRLVNKEALEVYLRDRIPLFPCVPTKLINDWMAIHGRSLLFVVGPRLEPPWQHCPKLFFNPKVDTVYISHHSTLPISNRIMLPRLKSVPNLKQLRSLACDWLSFENVDEALPGRVDQILEFPALEQFFVLKGNTGWWHYQRGKFKGEVSIVVHQCRRMNLVGIPQRINVIIDQKSPERRITIRNGYAVRETWY